MRPFASVLVLTLLIAVVAAVPVEASMPHAEWQFSHPYPSNQAIRDVAALSKGEAVAVGDDGTILHFDGSRWFRVESPTDEDLQAVFVLDDDDIYAAGAHATVLHFDGSEWSQLLVDHDGDGLADDDLHIEGIFRDDTTNLLVFMGEATTSCSAVCPFALVLGNASWSLQRYSDIDVETVWSDGARHFAGTTRGEVMPIYVLASREVLTNPAESTQLNNGSYEVVGIWSPNPDVLYAVLSGGQVHRLEFGEWALLINLIGDAYAVAGSENDLWVASDGRVHRLAGGQWEALSLESTGDRVFALEMETSMLAVGRSGTGSGAASISRFDGTSWIQEHHDLPSVSNREITSLWGFGRDDVFMTSRSTASGTLHHFDGQEWSGVDLPNQSVLSDLWGSADGELWIAGDEVVLHGNGNHWTEIPVAGADLAMIWGDDAGEILAVDDRWSTTNVYRYSPVPFERFSVNSPAFAEARGFTGLWFESNADAHLFDWNHDVITRWDGASLTDLDPCGSGYAFGLMGAPGGKMISVEYGPAILLYDGQECAVVFEAEDHTALNDPTSNEIWWSEHAERHWWVATGRSVYSSIDGYVWEAELLPSGGRATVAWVSDDVSSNEVQVFVARTGGEVLTSTTAADQVVVSAPASPFAARVEMLPNVPNPFNPATTIRFRLPSASEARLDVVDLRGRIVQTLHHGSLAAGDHGFTWNGTDRQGHEVASGTYFGRVRTSQATQSRALLLVK